MKKTISVITPCFNEEGNVANLVKTISTIFEKLPQYNYEHIFIDNDSSDNTVPILKKIASEDKRIKIIVNVRNFGQIKSPFHGMLQCHGDAIIYIVADFQDPPELIGQFLEKWEEGFKIVIGIKSTSKENLLMFKIRSFFYSLLSKASDQDNPPVKNFTGYGLYDQQFISILRTLDDPYPYFRGLISEIGFKRFEIKYDQPQRTAGKTKNNFFTLYEIAMLGFTSHSKLPLRLAAFVGFFSAIMSLLFALGYFIYKLVYWYDFQIGTAPMVIGVFLFSSVQLFFIGIIGEYIAAINTQIRKRPLVIEKERVNFDEPLKKD